MFKRTENLNAIKKLNKRYRIIQGSTSAGKTYAIIALLIDYGLKNKKKIIDIVSMTYDHLASGAIQDFKNIMGDTNRWIDKSWNDTKHIYTFANGTQVRFKSLDKPGKAKGPRRDVLYVNEANYIPLETFDHLSVRTIEFIYVDYNPSYRFWVHDLIGQPNVDFIKLTYKGNDGLSQNILNDLEHKRLTKSENWVRVYLDGEIGILEGSIFNNWKVVDKIPIDARLIAYGLDWGYTNDPTTIIGVYKIDNQLVVDEVLYQTGLTNQDIARIIKQEEISEEIYCDSAEPKSIREIKNYGIRALPTTKGKDSIVYGIQLLQDYEILVTKRSKNIIEEMEKYMWKKDREGNNLNIPIDVYNHCFIGDTLITTDKGYIPIRDIKEGDMVLTRSGYEEVLKLWDNGTKRVEDYWIETDTFDIYISSTPEHKVKTNEGWIEISKLQSGMMVILDKNIMDLSINYTQKKDTSLEVLEECTQMCGKMGMVVYKKDIISTTSMETLGIIESKILNVSKHINTSVNTEGKDLKIKNGSEISTQRGLKQLKNGIDQQRVGSGINNIVLNCGIIENIENSNVLSVEMNMKHDTQGYQNIVTTTVNQWHLGGEEKVYDLMVANNHEYFANGLLVHNCIDSIRYVALVKMRKKVEGRKFRFI